MVRVKERYLLINIVYPEAEGSRNPAASNLPDLLVYNQPTVDACTARTIHNAIRTEITNLFGDYGAGSIERTLRGSSLNLRAVVAPASCLVSELHTLFQYCTRTDILVVKYMSNATSTCILQCSRDHFRLVWAALTMIDRVPTKHGPGKPCIFRVVHVSGTIKHAEQEAVRRARLLILAAKDEMAGKESDALSAFFGGKDLIKDVAMADVDVDDDSASVAGLEDDDDDD